MAMSRKRRSPGMIAALVSGVLLTTSAGCEKAGEFRSVAGSSVEQGVHLIADGVIDGIFAVFEPDDTSD